MLKALGYVQVLQPFSYVKNDQESVNPVHRPQLQAIIKRFRDTKIHQLGVPDQFYISLHHNITIHICARI
jgi:hypothetical protein